MVENFFQKARRHYLHKKKRITGGNSSTQEKNRIIETIPGNFERKMADAQDNNKTSFSMANSVKTNQTPTLFSTFPELIPMENLKYVYALVKSLF